LEILEFVEEVAEGTEGDQICKEIQKIYTTPTEPAPAAVEPAPAPEPAAGPAAGNAMAQVLAAKAAQVERAARLNSQASAAAAAAAEPAAAELAEPDDSKNLEAVVDAENFIALLESAVKPTPAKESEESELPGESLDLLLGEEVVRGSAVDICVRNEEMLSLIKDLLRNKELLMQAWNDFNGGVSLMPVTVRDFLEVIIDRLAKAEQLRLSVNPQLIERVTANITDYSYENDRGGILDQEGFKEYLNTIVLYSGTIND